MISLAIQVCGFLSFICLIMVMGLFLVGFVIQFFSDLNMRTNLSQPTAAKLVYKPPTKFVMFLEVAFMGMLFVLFAIITALISFQTLIQPNLTSGVNSSKDPIINFMILLISGLFGLITFTAVCYSISELDLNKTTIFDKGKQIITIKRRTIFKKKLLKIPFKGIIDIKLENACMDDDGSYGKGLVIVLDNGSTLSLDSFSVNGEESDKIKRKEAERIKVFLGI
jgi:hypothetical protein